jgi:tetratricopeptide (TPR) repeat protein
MSKQLTIITHATILAALVASPLAARAEEALTPAEQQMAWATKQIAAQPDDPQPHVDLGWALARRARETGDPAYYGKGQEEASRAIALSPGNFEARKLEAWLLLGRHEFGRALDAAKVLNRQAPDDVMVYGFLADASAELGEYNSAEDAVQWMLDMRPGNLSGLTRAAYLREVFGDVDGAIDLYTTAFDRTSPLEVEDRAWIVSQVGHLYLSIGKTPEAGQALELALKLMPGYHYALGYLAKVRLAENRPANAVTLLRRLCEVAPHAENLYALAEALHRLGSAQAGTVYADFEQKALAESETADNANRELIFFYTDRRSLGGEARRSPRAGGPPRHPHARRQCVGAQRRWRPRESAGRGREGTGGRYARRDHPVSRGGDRDAAAGSRIGAGVSRAVAGRESAVVGCRRGPRRAQSPDGPGTAVIVTALRR